MTGHLRDVYYERGTKAPTSFFPPPRLQRRVRNMRGLEMADVLRETRKTSIPPYRESSHSCTRHIHRSDPQCVS